MTEPEFAETFAQHLAEMERDAHEGIARPPRPDSIAYFVRTQRGHWGWKRETLASMSGTSLSTIERVERGDPVSSESLDRIAVALGQSPGTFTAPRVPLGVEEVLRMLTESHAPFEDRIWIPVRPLRGQRQIAELARSDFYISDASRLVGRCDESAMNSVAGLIEFLDLASFILGTEDKQSIITVHREEPVKRRELYSDILTHAREVERRAHAVILVGTYEAATDNESMPNANVSVIGFFPKFSDPAAIKRHQLAVPAKICLNEAWNNFCADVKSLPSM